MGDIIRLRALHVYQAPGAGVDNVIYEQLLFESSEHVAQFKFTVLLMPNGPLKITGADFDVEQCSTENKIENEEILSLLKTSTKRKAAKKKKRAAEKAVAAAAGEACPTAVEQ